MAYEPMNTLVFLQKFGQLRIKISQVFDVEYKPETNNWLYQYFNKTFKDVLGYHNNTDYLDRDFQLARLNLLLKDFEMVKNYEKEMFKHFIGEMKSVGYDEYFGTRFEVDIAKSLIKKDVNFSKIESPDFSVEKTYKNIFIECSSSHMSKIQNKRDLEYKLNKIWEVVEKKKSKDYNKPDTALFIEITNLYYNQEMKGSQTLKSRELEKYVKLGDSDFGSIVFFVFLGNPKKSRFETHYIRNDNKNVNEELKDFLEENYPVEDDKLNRVYFPSES